jgi:hypothetical protein
MREDDDEREFLDLQRAAFRVRESGTPSPKRGKGARRKDTFVQVPLWWLEQVTKAARSPQQVFVGVWLLHLRWKAKGPRFPVPNGQLAKYGIDRRSKRLALSNFAKAGLNRTPASPLL